MSDGFEEVFTFITVRIPLDFLILLNHSGILYLPQPLLYKVVASEELCFAGISPKVHSSPRMKPHLGDDKAVIRPSVGTGDRLCRQHVVSISPPDDSIVQPLPAPRLRVHSSGLLPRQKAEEGVGQEETVFRTGSPKMEVVIVTATETGGTQHTLPGRVVCPDAGVEVAKDNKLVLLRHSHQQCVPVLVKFALRHIRARHL
ncbi:unnamed protein product [Schistocephalus solidus]|uniref:Uncharacterized protein n=1 Tax=Schistocephalus solidus TaxID=70667 RepID=A0A183TL47_SCHSO|nr:unnamed protein product [Schistocephalus solidus]